MYPNNVAVRHNLSCSSHQVCVWAHTRDRPSLPSSETWRFSYPELNLDFIYNCAALLTKSEEAKQSALAFKLISVRWINPSGSLDLPAWSFLCLKTWMVLGTLEKKWACSRCPYSSETRFLLFLTYQAAGGEILGSPLCSCTVSHLWLLPVCLFSILFHWDQQLLWPEPELG